MKRGRGLLQPPKPLNQGRLALDPSWRINLNRKKQNNIRLSLGDTKV